MQSVPAVVQQGFQLVERLSHDHRRWKSVPVIYGPACQCVSSDSCVCLGLHELHSITSCGRQGSCHEKLLVLDIHTFIRNLVQCQHITSLPTVLEPRGNEAQGSLAILGMAALLFLAPVLLHCIAHAQSTFGQHSWMAPIAGFHTQSGVSKESWRVVAG